MVMMMMTMMDLKTRDTKEEAGLSQRQRDERRFRELMKDQTVASKERGNPKSKVLLNRRDTPFNLPMLKVSKILYLSW